MLTIKTKKYSEKNLVEKKASIEEILKNLKDVGSDALSGAKNLAGKATGLTSNFLNNPLTEKLLGGTSTYEGIRGTTDLIENVGGSKLISLNEWNKINKLSEILEQDIRKEIEAANNFYELSAFSKYIFCRYKHYILPPHGGMPSEDHVNFQKFMNDIKENNSFFSRKYLEITRQSGGTSTLGPTDKTKKIVKEINKRFYKWLPGLMIAINNKFGIKNYADIKKMMDNECREI